MRIRPDDVPSAEESKPSRREAIGAFCTDISDSTERIELFRDEALRHHKSYLQAAGRHFVKSIPASSRKRYAPGDLWVPGDALWGVFYRESGLSLRESVIISLWRAVLSFAHGLSVANYAPPPGLDALRIRGVFLAGHVLREAIFGKLRLYNGRALNACGRLEKNAAPNTVIAGFVIPDGSHGRELLFESVARSPVIDISGLKRYVRSLPEPRGVGYDIGVDVVRDNDRHLLRFTGWPTRRDLRGLGDCNVLTTVFRLGQKKEESYDVCPSLVGEWERKEQPVTLREGESYFDLIELIEMANLRPFDFVQEVYERGDIKFLIPPERGAPPKLHCLRNRDRPRVLKGQRTTTVDFTLHHHCFLPTHTHTVSGGAKLLIQSYTREGNRALSFTKIPDHTLDSYDEYADYLDSAKASVEFIFSRPALRGS